MFAGNMPVLVKVTISPATAVFATTMLALPAVIVAATAPAAGGVCEVAMLFALEFAKGPTLTIIGLNLLTSQMTRGRKGPASLTARGQLPHVIGAQNPRLPT